VTRLAFETFNRCRREEHAMSAVQQANERVRAHRISPVVPWGLVAGGALFFAGGGMHPKQDPPDVTLKEHMRLMFEDHAWYPSHAILLAGMALMAAALVALASGRGLAAAPRAQLIAIVAAIATALGALGMVVHLLAAVDSDHIASGAGTPVVDTNLVVETITVPAFGLAIAALAVVGASTRTLGNRFTAVLGTVGGVAYALAGATFLLTDALDPLFPLAGAIGLWAVATGITLLRRAPTAERATAAAA
jgi:hypothetical protein